MTEYFSPTDWTSLEQARRQWAQQQAQAQALYGCPPPYTITTSNATNDYMRFYTEEEARRAGIKVEDCTMQNEKSSPPEKEKITEFKRLSNHEFHDLLDEFARLLEK